jgi:hypothetical protein
MVTADQPCKRSLLILRAYYGTVECDGRLFHVGNGNGVLWLLWMAEGLGMSSIGSHEAETISK